MSRYIIILYTVIYTLKDLQQLSDAIDSLDGILNWSIDLDDCDKVLRIVADREVGDELITKFQLLGIGCSELETFENVKLA